MVSRAATKIKIAMAKETQVLVIAPIYLGCSYLRLRMARILLHLYHYRMFVNIYICSFKRSASDRPQRQYRMYSICIYYLHHSVSTISQYIKAMRGFPVSKEAALPSSSLILLTSSIFPMYGVQQRGTGTAAVQDSVHKCRHSSRPMQLYALRR